jgi:serine/threonine-protein kinase
MYGLSPGTKIGPYVLDAPLGAGGQGSVWRSHHESIPGEPIALKVIPVRGSPITLVERVRREAEALIRLSTGHPSVVQCRGLVEDQGQGVLAVAMEMVSGVELSAALADPRCDVAAREAILGHVASALAHLHAAGFVHRDLKPANVLVTHAFYASPKDPATVKLVDFGIATPTGNPKPLTEVGTVIGTPAYMPPERIDPMFWSAAPSAPTEDVFAFGVVAYEAFFGKHPAGVEDDGTLSTYAEKYRAVSRANAPWPDVPPAHRWARALSGALALKRTERLSDGGAIVVAIGGSPVTPAGFVVPVASGPKTEVAPALSADAFAPPPALGMTPTPWAPPAAAPAPMMPAASPYAPPPAAFPAIGAPPPQMHHGHGASGDSNPMFKIIGGVALLGVLTVGILLFAQRRSSSDDLPPPTGGTSPDVPASTGSAAPATTDPTAVPPDPGSTTALPPTMPPPPYHPPATHPPGTVVVGPGSKTPPTPPPPSATPPPHIGPGTGTGGSPGRPGPIKITLPPGTIPPTTPPATPPGTPPTTPPTPPGGRPHIQIH